MLPFKRRNKRYFGKFPILFDFYGAERKGLLLNFSQTGLFIECDTLPDPGEILNLTLQTKSKDKIPLKGKVVWSRSGMYSLYHPSSPRGIGLDLVDLDPKYLFLLERLQEFLSRNPTNSPHQDSQDLQPIHYKSGTDFLTEYCQDLSKGGLYLATQNLFKEGEKVPLKIHLEDSKAELTFEATVAHTLSKQEAQAQGKPTDIGVQFLDLSPEAIKKIQVFTQSLKNTPSLRPNSNRSRIPLKGSLKEFILPHIFMGIASHKYTGKLNIELTQNTFKIFFYQGDLLYSTDEKNVLRFYSFLDRQGKISVDLKKQLSLQLKTAEPDDSLLRDFLLRRKVFLHSQIHTFWKKYQQARLKILFSHFTGTFSFEQGIEKEAISYNEPISLLSTCPGILEGVYDVPTIQTLFPIRGKTLVSKNESHIPPDLPSHFSSFFKSFSKPTSLRAISKNNNITILQLSILVLLAYFANWIDLKNPS